ncbi:centrosomal AT-AC splicing factor-like [Oscarella lobularis]|uniref:centrosomal AT-AC splicing factor-like n=1 Tax=Oscarella lobularis TaxID=121494 RepID=UPI0033134EFE
MATKNAEYTFCSVCRLNHNAGRKHIYSKTHTSKLGSLITRFTSKLKDARRALKRPDVDIGSYEATANVWCYCCKLEVNKHVTNGDITIKYGGIIEHMASDDHHKNTRHWFWENGCDVKLQPQYLVHQLEYDKYKEALESAIDEKESILAAKRNEEAITIKQQEMQRSFLLSQSQNRKTTNEAKAVATPLPSAAAAKTGKKFRGNVHTGATPPWLRDDDDDDDEPMPVIGPSEDAFREHVTNERRRKRNPNRVGANFAQKVKETRERQDDDEKWLPSFGRVWNHGPRSHSKLEFISERKGHNSSAESSAAPPDVKPYVSKKWTTDDDVEKNPNS